jgi:hypothetical protein
MNAIRIILIIIFIFLVLYDLYFFITFFKRSNEGYSMSMKKATILPTGGKKQFYLQNFENFIFSTTPDDSKLTFNLKDGYITVSPQNSYVGLLKMHLSKNFYILAIVPKKSQVKNKWNFEKKSGNKYYLYQKFGNKKIYVYINKHVVTGSDKKKTAFTIKKKK